MGYLGTKPSSGFITTAKQRVTSSTNNYVDLDNAISSLSDVIVWVNSVKQDSTNLTLTTSTRITLGDTLTASDVVEIAYLGKAVATQTPDTGTVTNDMLAGSIANSKLANSSITLNGSAVSLGGSATVGGTNTPNFLARMTSAQNIGGEATVIFNAEDFDTASAYNTSTGEFTVPSAGKYYFTTVCTNSASYGGMYLNIRKAGTHVIRGTSFNANAGSVSANGIVECSANEVVVVRLENGTQQNLSTSSGHTFFGGFKLIT